MTVAFFLLTFAVSWSCYIAAAAVVRGSLPSGQPAIAIVLIYAGTFTPALVALTVTAAAGGRDGVGALLERMLRWDVDTRWYAFAVGYMAAVKAAAAIGQRIVAGTWPRAGELPWFLLIPAVLVSTPVQAGEELGWRGLAFPRLAARFGFAAASILLGIIWAVWHLPLFFIPGVDLYRQSFWAFLFAVTPLSVAMAWLYLRTGGNVLLTMLMHSAVNQTTLLVSGADAASRGPFVLTASAFGWFTITFLWLGAAFCIARSSRVD